ncbi:unnamed protein product [Amoebophrya sp. A25]|nr:unnamed protein product [Amoebophrya sp. A25]|eukprot:GSA25T00015774001.1
MSGDTMTMIRPLLRSAHLETVTGSHRPCPTFCLPLPQSSAGQSRRETRTRLGFRRAVLPQHAAGADPHHSQRKRHYSIGSIEQFSSRKTTRPATASQAKRYFAKTALKPTIVKDSHVAYGGKLVDFAGYALPVQYSSSAMNAGDAAERNKHALSIVDSVKWTRESCSLFDVSHMCSLSWHGRDATEFLETMCVADVQALAPGQGGLSLLTSATGGIIDDTMITKLYGGGQEEEYFLKQGTSIGGDSVGNSSSTHDSCIYQVINAGCADKDLDHLKKHLETFTSSGKDCRLRVHWDERGLFALQGPQAAGVLERLAKQSVAKFGFGSAFFLDLVGTPCLIARGGYTGEDGFEIFAPKEVACQVWDGLLEDDAVRLAGLGVRDALRLEAGLCLYGHDIHEETTPVEASLLWTIAKTRRSGTRANFLGAEPVLKQVAEKSDSKRRVGLVVEGPVPAREGMDLLDPASGNKIGVVTSGRESPVLGTKIAMGYLNKPFNKIGSSVKVKIRSKTADAKVVKMPFVETRYYKV